MRFSGLLVETINRQPLLRVQRKYRKYLQQKNLVPKKAVHKKVQLQPSQKQINKQSNRLNKRQQNLKQLQKQQAQQAAAASQAAQEQTTPSSSSQADATAQYGTVQSGEGPKQIAARYGLSVDEFLQLNGMTLDSFYFDPGQQVRVK